MVVVSILPNAEFGRNDHREDAVHFMNQYHFKFIMGYPPKKIESDFFVCEYHFLDRTRPAGTKRWLYHRVACESIS